MNGVTPFPARRVEVSAHPGPHIRVAVVDDHEIVRLGIGSVIAAHRDLEFVGAAASASEGLELIQRTRPDVAVVDERLPDRRGSELCRDVVASGVGTRLIVLTSYDDDDALFAAIVAGASGYLLKEVRSGTIVEAIRTVAAGNSLLDPAVTGNVLRKIRSSSDEDPRLRNLSPRQRELLAHIAEGMSNREIAEVMFLGEQTVKNYVSQLLRALSMQRRSQVAAFGAGLKSSPNGR